MRRSFVVLLIAVATGAGARAGEPAPVTPDLRGEIAWARATWSGELRGVHFHTPLAKLLGWAPARGSAVVYLYTNDFACRRATLARPERTEDDGEDAAAPRTLIARINHRTRTGDGEQVREVTFVEVGARLSREDGSVNTEARDAAGRWQPAASGGIGLEPIVYGALSYADDRVARWDGEPTEIHPYCNGPVEWLTCPAGGERPCERCDDVSLVLTQPGAMWGHGRDHGGRAVTCHDRCPLYPPSPDMARLHGIQDRVQTWRPRKAPIALVPSLYRSRADCLREHPAPKRP